MINGITYEGTLFWILLYLWVVVEIFFGVRARLLKRGRPKKQNDDRGSVLFIVFGTYIFIYVSVIFSIRQWGVLPSWTKYVGYVLMIIGMVIRYSAIFQLGRFFSPVVGVVANQEIIQSGFYRWIRHPAYTGGWLTVVGVGLGLRTWWGTFLCGVGLLLIYAYRIHVEEQAMIRHFGEKYLSYIKITKKMFPGIW